MGRRTARNTTPRPLRGSVPCSSDLEERPPIRLCREDGVDQFKCKAGSTQYDSFRSKAVLIQWPSSVKKSETRMTVSFICMLCCVFGCGSVRMTGLSYSLVWGRGSSDQSFLSRMLSKRSHRHWGQCDGLLLSISDQYETWFFELAVHHHIS